MNGSWILYNNEDYITIMMIIQQWRLYNIHEDYATMMIIQQLWLYITMMNII
jgi:hypothetical protein